jgi:hypothetical protein
MVQQTISATTINSFDARKYVFGTTCGLVSGIAASSSKHEYRCTAGEILKSRFVVGFDGAGPSDRATPAPRSAGEGAAYSAMWSWRHQIVSQVELLSSSLGLTWK